MGLERWVNVRNNVRNGLVSVLLLLTVASWAVSAPNLSDSAVRTVDAQVCGGGASLTAYWSESERWAWRQICHGQAADFDALFNTQKDSGRQTDDRFAEPRRKLGAGFLRTVLTREPFRSAIPAQGVQIKGASFDEDVILRDVGIVHVFGIVDSRFRGKLDMNRLRTPSTVAFTGSTFEDKLSLDSVNIGGNLNMTYSEFGEVVLKTAEIAGGVSMSDSRFLGRLSMNGATVGGALFMRKAVFADVDLTEAAIGRQLSTSGSTFNGTLEMGSLSTGGHLLMNEGSSFGDVFLRGARIAGQLSVSDAVFRGQLDGQSTSVEQDLMMTGARFERPVDLPMIRIGGGVNIGGASLSVLNLSGATVGKDLAFGAGGRSVQWRSYTDSDGRIWDPWVFLWNASVGALIDDTASWPDNVGLSLRDFRYERLTPFGGRGGRFGDLRDVAWYIDWLRRDPSYSFQPYQQLAKVLEAYGEDGKANKVLIAGRERERMQLPWWSPEGWWLLALRLLIGYGYGAGELLALIWAIPLIWTGGVVAQSKGQPRSNDERPGFWYSLDMLLPGIWLSQRHTKFELDGRARYYFYVHRLVGYVLLFFVVAGLAGLTE